MCLISLLSTEPVTQGVKVKFVVTNHIAAMGRGGGLGWTLDPPFFFFKSNCVLCLSTEKLTPRPNGLLFFWLTVPLWKSMLCAQSFMLIFTGTKEEIHLHCIWENLSTFSCNDINYSWGVCVFFIFPFRRRKGFTVLPLYVCP